MTTPPKPERSLLVSEVEEAAIRKWAERKGLPVRGPFGLPRATISAYESALTAGRMRTYDYPKYAPEDEMSPILVPIGLREQWEANGGTGKIRPADLAGTCTPWKRSMKGVRP
ncbi:hypothetical protein ACFY0G_40355 [Streptomyces sp. NPDC001552]|uniref:hypothetical protein n=1 Tax=Streptomyces sp. NPDC001552 TaxID=3364587 RepID=UPI003681A7ED